MLARPMVKRPMMSRSRPMPIIANSSGTSSTAFSTWVAHEDRHQRDIRNQDGERADERDDPERQIEGPGLGVRIVNSRFDARILAYRVSRSGAYCQYTETPAVADAVSQVVAAVVAENERVRRS